MVEHVKVLGWIGVVRALLGGPLGLVLLVRSTGLDALRQSEPGDAALFAVAGGLLVVFSVLWLVQGIAVLRMRPWARGFGLFLAVVDLLSLFGFPLSTALGLYAFVTYRNPETVDHFASR